jgi:hypothetical protein
VHGLSATSEGFLLANDQHTTQCYPRRPVRVRCCVKLAQSAVAEERGGVAQAELAVVVRIRAARSV